KEHLIEPRRAAIKHAEAVAALIHIQEGLDFAIRQLNVADQAIKAKGIKADLARGGIDQLVVQHDGNIELREAGQVEAGALISGVELIEDVEEAFQALVGILRRVIDAMIVIPERA